MAAIEFDSLKELGSGSYNMAYRVGAEGDVVKIPKTPKKTASQASIALDTPERAVRLFNELNPSLPAEQKASIIMVNKGEETIKAWRAPYLGSTPASDRQIAEAILEIFRGSRRIVLDGCGKGNFLRFNDETYCIDPGYALRVRGESESKGERRRRASIVSNDFLHGHSISKLFAQGKVDKKTKEKKVAYWKEYERKKPLSVTIIRNLYFLTKQVAADDIEDYHINYDIIKALTSFRQRNQLINKPLLNLMSAFSKHGLAIPKEVWRLFSFAEAIEAHEIKLNEIILPLIASAVKYTKTDLIKDINWSQIKRKQGDEKEVLSEFDFSPYRRLLTKLIDVLIIEADKSISFFSSKSEIATQLHRLKRNINDCESLDKTQLIAFFHQAIKLCATRKPTFPMSLFNTTTSYIVEAHLADYLSKILSYKKAVSKLSTDEIVQLKRVLDLKAPTEAEVKRYITTQVLSPVVSEERVDDALVFFRAAG